MTARAGEVYRRGDMPGDHLVVVLSRSEYNEAAGRALVCPLMLTDQIGTTPPPERFHTLSPSPGYLAHGLALHLPLAALRVRIGEAEPAALEACRDVLRDALTAEGW